MRILAVGAHLDDPEIACGGVLARARAAGHAVKMLVLSDSSYSNYDGTVLRTMDEARQEGTAAASILGIADLEVLNFSTKDIPYHSTVVEAIQARIDEFDPTVILAHWPFDTHQAHHHSALATLSAARYRTSILMYEPMMPSGRSYVGFRPQIYVDVSDFIQAKLDALKAHHSQFRKYGDAWIEGVESRCRLRGFEMGVKYAEAFEAARMEWQLMIVTIHQPEHMPWLGFCHKASLADVMVLLDVVQYRTNYFQNRNRILGPNGPQWLTVPVLTKGHTGRTIGQMEISNQESWRIKCWKSIVFCYHNHPYFNHYANWFEELYAEKWDRLSHLNETIVRHLFTLLGIRTKLVRASDLGARGSSSALLVDLCRQTGATTYLAGQCAGNYLDRTLFDDAGIQVARHRFMHPEYTQKNGAGFVSGLSALDLLFNLGPESIHRLRVATPAWKEVA